MDIKRATEIIESLGVIEVSYNGDPIWLEDIDKENNTVKVKNINTAKELIVDISDLKED
ncbi:H-type small acid-soluble spore protein [Clostridium sp. MB40-C1]|uniref:H-type small acid-soluble spore protein n=1 Tax=Clostridium sp. MB40-C1 TaxID=3070996 RepID=UPI0027DEEB5C|nr:H-type small acid-soluble spore protein [Clostridium sp. MB40-C1]WMJ81891.1 H-type small acid-soluble spore protein [Clostridium sp. MB40-C1]